MGNKKYLIFIAVVMFSAVLFSNKANAQESDPLPSQQNVAACAGKVMGMECDLNGGPQKGICYILYQSTGTLSCVESGPNPACAGRKLCDPCSYYDSTYKTTVNGVCYDSLNTGSTIGLLTELSCEKLPEGLTCNGAGTGNGTGAGTGTGTGTETGMGNGTPSTGTGVTATTEFANPIACTTAQCLLIGLLKTLQGVVAIIAIVMIVIGGMMYMFAGVNEKSVELGKKMIGGAVIGLAIVVAAPAFLKELLAVLGGSGVDDSGLLAGAPSLKTIAERILQLVLSIAGILGIIGLIIGGGYYMTAYGDEDRIKKGKMVIGASLIGILFALAALVIVRQIAKLLG